MCASSFFSCLMNSFIIGLYLWVNRPLAIVVIFYMQHMWTGMRHESTVTNNWDTVNLFEIRATRVVSRALRFSDVSMSDCSWGRSQFSLKHIISQLAKRSNMQSEDCLKPLQLRDSTEIDILLWCLLLTESGLSEAPCWFHCRSPFSV